MIMSSDRPRTPHEALCQMSLKRRAADMLRVAPNMRPEDWRVERDLSMTKWFDYRFITPLEATMQFVEDYRFVFRAKWKSNFDAATADLERLTERHDAAGEALVGYGSTSASRRSLD